MINSSLDKRLLSCADYVRAGAVFADIGTDHGYLPLFLLRSGRIERAYLSDVNEGPLSSARANAASEGLLDRCEFTLADGAAALSGKGITDYAICGMGGELIASIIDAAEHLKVTGVRLILQPMTKQAHLRKYLLTSGFEIIAESYSFAEGKYYVTIVAEYVGESREGDIFECELGSESVREGDRVAYIGYLEGKARALNKSLSGKMHAGLSADTERELLTAIEERIASVQ